MPVSLVSDEDDAYDGRMSSIVEFTERTICYADEGVLHFGDIVIDTAAEDGDGNDPYE